MLNREQAMLMFKMRARKDSIFCVLPPEVIQHIYHAGHASFDKNSDIAKLLHHIAYGEYDEAKAMLGSNPQLLLEDSNVVAPSGDTILAVRPYECALGAGDDDMAAMIKDYFAKIVGGEKEEARQYAGYKKHIDTMLTQPHYDLEELMKIILKSSSDDVTAALDCNMKHDSKLQNALAKFRKDFAPRVITEGMHFNYQNLQHAFNIYVGTFDILKRRGHSYDKCDLFWQVIDYIQRGLPACDRQALKEGIYLYVTSCEGLQRRFGGGTFPVTAGDKSFNGLGYRYARARGAGYAAGARFLTAPEWWLFRTLETICKVKTSNLQNLCCQGEKKRVRVSV